MPEGSFYKVKAGDCVSSIAQRNGLFWETVWNHPENSDLKNKREDPNILAPGDKIFIPKLRKNQIDCATDQKARFKKKGIPAFLRLRFLEKGEPRANVPYKLTINTQLIEGQTDGDGCIQEPIDPTAKKGILILGEGDQAQRFELDLGTMDPIESNEGIRKRLKSLGFIADNDSDEELERVICEFQAHKKLKVSGKLDDSTKKELQDAFGY